MDDALSFGPQGCDSWLLALPCTVHHLTVNLLVSYNDQNIRQYPDLEYHRVTASAHLNGGTLISV